MDTTYCTECLCLLDNYCNVTHAIIGDGYCHDEANHDTCNFDEGDCCGNCKLTDFCSICECLGGPDVVNPLLGNGHCNDETNNPQCNFDDGDCCGACINTEHCSDCVCHTYLSDSAIDLSCKLFLTKYTIRSYSFDVFASSFSGKFYKKI